MIFSAWIYEDVHITDISDRCRCELEKKVARNLFRSMGMMVPY